MSDYERAAALIAESKDDADFAGPRPPELIQAAEEALGVQFPPTYRRFVSEMAQATSARPRFTA
jgi:hypothetical protein